MRKEGLRPLAQQTEPVWIIDYTASRSMIYLTLRRSMFRSWAIDLTKAPIGPWLRPCARLAPIVATMPTARLPLRQRWYRVAPTARVERRHGRLPRSDRPP
jgi:hypothetical protein